MKRREFIAAAMTTGIGMALSPKFAKAEEQINEGTLNIGPVSTIPILVMDMYEHSYQMGYGAQAAKFVDAYFQHINWDETNSRLEKTRKIKMT